MTLPILFRARSNEKFIVSVIGFAIFTDLFLYGLIVPILPYALTPRFGVGEGRVQSSTSLLLAIYAAGLLVSCPVVGWCADASAARRTPLLTGLVALLGSTLLFTLGKTFAVLVVARLLQGISGAVVWTVGLALLVDTVGEERLGVAMGVVSIFMSFGIALGPVLGGILYDVGGYYAPFYLAFGFLLLDIVLRLLIIEKKTAKLYLGSHLHKCDAEPVATSVIQLERGEKDTTAATATTATASLSRWGRMTVPPIITLLRYPRLLTGCWLGFISATLLSSFDAVLPLYLKDLWSLSPLSSGLVYGSLVLPSFIISPFVGWWIDSRGTKGATLLGLLLEIPLLVALRFPNGTSPRAGQVVEMCFLLALNDFGISCVLISALTEIALVVERQASMRPGLFGKSGAFAQAYALFNMSFSAGTLVGPLVAGAIRDKSDWATMTWSLSLFAVVSIPACLYYTGGHLKDTHWIKAREKDVTTDSQPSSAEVSTCQLQSPE